MYSLLSSTGCPVTYLFLGHIVCLYLHSILLPIFFLFETMPCILPPLYKFFSLLDTFPTTSTLTQNLSTLHPSVDLMFSHPLFSQPLLCLHEISLHPLSLDLLCHSLQPFIGHSYHPTSYFLPFVWSNLPYSPTLQ